MTGADNKTMPGTPEFREAYDRIYGARKPQRGVWVLRCETCDGVTLPEGGIRYDCEKCSGKGTRGSIDIAAAPPLRSDARAAPIMVDRFMEDAAPALDGTDISSRKKRREYMKREGIADASDYGKGYGEKIRERRDNEHAREVRETVGRAAYELFKP